MFFRTLPSTISSGENKGKPNMVEITSAKIQDADGKSHKFVIPAEKFSYPQFGPQPTTDDKGNEHPLTEDQAQEGVNEAIKDAGGVVRFLENYNNATATAALNKGKGYIRTTETGTPTQIEEQGLKHTHEFTWAKAERITNAQVRQGAEQLAAEVDNLDPAELKRRLLALVGK